jgi:hypothetical protein
VPPPPSIGRAANPATNDDSHWSRAAQRQTERIRECLSGNLPKALVTGGRRRRRSSRRASLETLEAGPKGSRNVGAVLRDVIDQKIQITENGKIRHLPALEVMLRRAFNDAMRSGPGAQKFFFSLIDRYADLSETAVVPEIDEVLAEDQEILTRYLGKGSGTASDSSEHPEDDDSEKKEHEDVR